MNSNFRHVIILMISSLFLFSSCLMIQHLLEHRLSVRANNVAVELAMQTVEEEDDTATSYPELTSEPAIEGNVKESIEEPLTPVPHEAADELLPEPVPMAPAPENKPEPSQKPLSKTVQLLAQIELDALRAVNENVIGWIYIPDSSVNYPLLAYTDNEYGLHHAWDGTENSAGSIFLECKNNRDFSDFNTLIYGHNNRNGTMFSELVNYSEEEYLNSHSSVYIVTDDWVRRYTVFSVYEADVVSDTYRLYFEDDERKQSSLDHYTSSTDVNTEIIPSTDDRILTLSTCMNYVTNGTRWVVQTVLSEEFEK